MKSLASRGFPRLRPAIQSSYQLLLICLASLPQVGPVLFSRTFCSSSPVCASPTPTWEADVRVMGLSFSKVPQRSPHSVPVSLLFWGRFSRRREVPLHRAGEPRGRMGTRQHQTQKSNCSTSYTRSGRHPHFSDRKIEATLKLRRGCVGVGEVGGQGMEYVGSKSIVFMTGILKH